MPIRIAETCSLDIVPKSVRPVVEADENFRLRVVEVKRYLALDTVRRRGGISFPSVRHQIQTALAALQAAADAESELITVKAFDHVLRHMDESHSRRLGHFLLWELWEHIQPFKRRGVAGKRSRAGGHSPMPGDGDPAQPIWVTMPLSFQVPYNAHYGRFNIGFLRMLAPASFDSRLLRPYLAQCLEIRGFPTAQGVYPPLAHLDKLLDLMQLRCDQGSIPAPTNSSLDAFTHDRWYLVAPTRSSDVFPVDRATNLVHASDGRVISFSTFLSEFFPQGTYLDTQLAHNPEWLVHFDEMSPSAARSCDGSVSLATTETQRFRLGKRAAQPSRGDGVRVTEGEKEGKEEGEGDPLLRTRAWLETKTSGKKRRI
ncbi:hypothetical protein RB595_010454 [Gaeumannomyces hyphopodioides]